MTKEEALEVCRKEVARRGYHVSAGCWCDEGQAVAFSVESYGPATYGAAKLLIQARDYNDGKGWIFLCENRPIEIQSR